MFSICLFFVKIKFIWVIIIISKFEFFVILGSGWAGGDESFSLVFTFLEDSGFYFVSIRVIRGYYGFGFVVGG